MKKVFISLFVAMTIALASCGGSAKTEENKDAAATEQTEVKADEAPAAEGVVAQYGVIVEKYIAAAQKVKGGDMAAAAEMAPIAEEMSKFAQDNAEALGTLSEEDAKTYAEIVAKMADAMK